jgi:hypothetical protein
MEKAGEMKIIEIKENWKIQINENKLLKSIIEKKNKDYEDALEVIGKLKMSTGEQNFLEIEKTPKNSLFSIQKYEEIFIPHSNPSKKLDLPLKTKDQETQTLPEAPVFSFHPESNQFESTPTLPVPETFSDWLNPSKSDARTFFDSLEPSSSISSFFQ